MAPCLPLGGVHVRTGQQLHIAEIVDGCAALRHLRERLLHCLLVAVAHPRLLCLACNLQQSLLRLCSSCWPWHRCLCNRVQVRRSCMHVPDLSSITLFSFFFLCARQDLRNAVFFLLHWSDAREFNSSKPNAQQKLWVEERASHHSVDHGSLHDKVSLLRRCDRQWRWQKLHHLHHHAPPKAYFPALLRDATSSCCSPPPPSAAASHFRLSSVLILAVVASLAEVPLLSRASTGPPASHRVVVSSKWKRDDVQATVWLLVLLSLSPYLKSLSLCLYVCVCVSLSLSLSTCFLSEIAVLFISHHDISSTSLSLSTCFLSEIAVLFISHHDIPSTSLSLSTCILSEIAVCFSHHSTSHSMHNQSCTPTTTQAHRHNLSHHEMAALKIVLVENLKASSYHDDTVEENLDSNHLIDVGTIWNLQLSIYTCICLLLESQKKMIKKSQTFQNQNLDAALEVPLFFFKQSDLLGSMPWWNERELDLWLYFPEIGHKLCDMTLPSGWSKHHLRYLVTKVGYQNPWIHRVETQEFKLVSKSIVAQYKKLTNWSWYSNPQNSTIQVGILNPLLQSRTSSSWYPEP